MQGLQDVSSRSVLLANLRNQDKDYQRGWERVFGRKKNKSKVKDIKALNANDPSEKSS